MFRAASRTHIRSSSNAPKARAFEDVDGKEYLDFTSGIGVLNTAIGIPASSAPCRSNSSA